MNTRLRPSTDPAEFRTRVLFAVMRTWRTDVVRCAELEVDLLRQEAHVGETILDVTKTQWLLLVRMAMCKGKPVANAELCRFARIQRDLEWINLRDAVRHLRARLGPVSNVVVRLEVAAMASLPSPTAISMASSETRRRENLPT